MIEITMDDRGFRELQKAFPKIVDQAIKSALKRAMSQGATALRNDVAGEAFMKRAIIARAISKVTVNNEPGGATAVITVQSAQLPADEFKVIPNTVTAKKARPMRQAPSPGYKVGRTQKLRRVPREGQRGAGFVANIRGKRMLMRRRSPSRNDLERVRGVSVQYFAAFDKTQSRFYDIVTKAFNERLPHEVNYRLGKFR